MIEFAPVYKEMHHSQFYVQTNQKIQNIKYLIFTQVTAISDRWGSASDAFIFLKRLCVKVKYNTAPNALDSPSPPKTIHKAPADLKGAGETSGTFYYQNRMERISAPMGGKLQF